MEAHMVIRDRYIGAAAAVAGGVLWYLTTTLPEVPVHGDVGPAFFPRLVAGALFLVSVGLFAMDALTRRAGGGEKREPVDKKTFLEICVLLLATGLYIGFMSLAGFVASTAVFLLCCGMIFGDAHKVKLAVFSIACSGLLYLGFKIWLRVPLPA
jgi:hypothetical protein